MSKHDHDSINRILNLIEHKQAKDIPEEIRPEMIQMAKELISDPNFPDELTINETAAKIYEEYFDNSPGRPSE